jgi:hypothetical protein
MPGTSQEIVLNFLPNASPQVGTGRCRLNLWPIFCCGDSLGMLSLQTQIPDSRFAADSIDTGLAKRDTRPTSVVIVMV